MIFICMTKFLHYILQQYSHNILGSG